MPHGGTRVKRGQSGQRAAAQADNARRLSRVFFLKSLFVVSSDVAKTFNHAHLASIGTPGTTMSSKCAALPWMLRGRWSTDYHVSKDDESSDWMIRATKTSTKKQKK